MTPIPNVSPDRKYHGTVDGSRGGDAFASTAFMPRIEKRATAHPPHSKPPNNMNPTIRKTSQNDARVAFEITRPCASTTPMEVWRIRAHPDHPVSMPDGIILESDHQQTIAVVVNVRPSDIIVIRHKAGLESMESCQHYRITDSFEPCFVEDPNLLYQRVTIAPPTNRIEADAGRTVCYSEREMRMLFEGKHPRWLQNFVDGQLLRWRELAPEVYVRFAPKKWLDRDVSLVAIHAPNLALIDYKDSLTWDQFEFCIRRLPAAAVRFVFDRIPQELRATYLKDHATYILDNLIDHLTNTELRTCSWGDPITAFKSRHFLSPRRSAILLSSSYTIAWIGNLDGSGPEFRKEVFDSLSQFPDEWLRSNKKGFQSIFKRLKSLLGICFDGTELLELLGKMAPRYRKILAEYLARHI